MAADDRAVLECLCRDYGEAALTGVGWSDLLRRTAVASGGWAAHFLVIKPSGEVSFSIGGGLSADILEEFEKRGGSSLGNNPRGAVLGVNKGIILSESNFIAETARQKSPIYAEYFNRIDAPYCQIVHFGGGEATPVVALQRGARQGLPSERDNAVFEALIPHITMALKVRRALGEAALTGALESFASIGHAAFVCDVRGRIHFATEEGESLLSGQDNLAVLDGALVPVHRLSAQRLSHALAKACGGLSVSHPPQVVLLQDSQGESVGELTVVAIPPNLSPFDRNALCLVHAQLIASGLDLRRLTTAEKAICMLLSRGLGNVEIATTRGVSRETVRSQCKTIYSKLGIRGRLELAALMHRRRPWGSPESWG